MIECVLYGGAHVGQSVPLGIEFWDELEDSRCIIKSYLHSS
jgi:hypothetical protein